MANHKQHIKALATRFKVFRFVLNFYGSNGKMPTGREIADELGISPWCALNHLRELHGADGMPQYNVGRNSRNMTRTRGETAAYIMAKARGHRFDENAIPLDILLSD